MFTYRCVVVCFCLFCFVFRDFTWKSRLFNLFWKKKRLIGFYWGAVSTQPWEASPCRQWWFQNTCLFSVSSRGCWNQNHCVATRWVPPGAPPAVGWMGGGLAVRLPGPVVGSSVISQGHQCPLASTIYSLSAERELMCYIWITLRRESMGFLSSFPGYLLSVS